MTTESYYAKVLAFASAIVRDTIERDIKGIETKLEAFTNSLDNDIPDIKASALPEYQRAKDALRKYSKAISNKIEKLDRKKK